MKTFENESKDQNDIELKDKLAFIVAAFEVFLPVFLIVIVGVFFVVLLFLKFFL
ncbi:hypothetical protein [Clostridium felsineum]|uniref:Uncharacterized protein n=1 Tax=Clostridium felsineum TaxID=36839 RepID=A0A1S8LJW3_9CLOT|nr:hypothetical protein [Clostridium felsineum]URZ07254.1 hypothetical protein CLROS_025920 [Clostridium felsineum]URZ12283.1 hypothetical protein CROST_030050 [Clostridium felsineum]